ncbi:chalcone-flavanone isomerase family protein [Actinidia rufa]|uniref:Chalcone-flavonone isomerase family protein n=1 Tax=Actinidia rufa TaxID=165716 RepID=A0A7J0GVH5_9ERIC|nr:chalcone-flavanone isomerase family protein [Actinidia rufa]
MSPPTPVTGVQIETVIFPPTAKPPGTAKPFFLGGAGERGLEIEGRFIKFTAIGVYLEENAVPSLAVKWKGKSPEELTESVEFFRDIVSVVVKFKTRIYALHNEYQCGELWNANQHDLNTPRKMKFFMVNLSRYGNLKFTQPRTMPPSPPTPFYHHKTITNSCLKVTTPPSSFAQSCQSFQPMQTAIGVGAWEREKGEAERDRRIQGPFEKFTQVTMILPLTGKQYSEKVMENCVAFWKAVGIYTDAEAKAVKKFIEVFKDETFPPGASILFTQSPLGSLTISFSKDGSIPETGNAVIENKHLSEAVLESIIGKHGVSPAAKRSLAARMSEVLKECGNEAPETTTAAPKEISA